MQPSYPQLRTPSIHGVAYSTANRSCPRTQARGVPGGIAALPLQAAQMSPLPDNAVHLRCRCAAVTMASDGNHAMVCVRTLTRYSNKFTLVRIDKLLIAYHLNVLMYHIMFQYAQEHFHDTSKSDRHVQS
jgi:hypothetical protein